MFFGDFNVVREALVHYGSIFCHAPASAFNDIIDNLGVINVPMIGKRFTRIDTIGAKVSKLDRFLASEGLCD